MRVLTLCLAVLVAGSLAPLGADTYPRQPAVDAVHYRFELTLTDDSPRIEAVATPTFRLLAPVLEIALDLMSREPAAGKGMAVAAVTSGGRAVAFTHDGNRLRLPVPETTQPGQDITYTIRYAGVPSDGLQVFTNLHGERVVFSEGWPNRARHWLPMIDHPYDKATGELIVEAPAHYQVVSNGLLVEEVDTGNARRRTHWRQSVPIASWLYAVGIARFDTHHAGAAGDVPLQTWVYPQDRVQGRELFEETSRRAMEFFSERVGPYPYEKLANVQAAGFGGGMENATVIFYGEKSVAAGRGPVVHEIAHQWFGNSVTETDWDDVWLSEGFATYFALLYTEQFEGRDAFAQGLARSRATILEQEKKTPDTPVIHRNLGDMEKVLNTFVYQKGGWVLHMLRRELGDETFWAGIRGYYRRYRDRNASTDDLRQVMESVSGKDLRGFFAQWLTRAGVPRVAGTWRFDPARQAIDVTLAQTQAGDPYRLLVDLGIGTAGTGEGRTEQVELTAARQTFTLPAAAAPASITIDPDTFLLAEIVPLAVRR